MLESDGCEVSRKLSNFAHGLIEWPRILRVISLAGRTYHYSMIGRLILKVDPSPTTDLTSTLPP